MIWQRDLVSGSTRSPVQCLEGFKGKCTAGRLMSFSCYNDVACVLELPAAHNSICHQLSCAIECTIVAGCYVACAKDSVHLCVAGYDSERASKDAADHSNEGAAAEPVGGSSSLGGGRGSISGNMQLYSTGECRAARHLPLQLLHVREVSKMPHILLLEGMCPAHMQHNCLSTHADTARRRLHITRPLYAVQHIKPERFL